MSKTLSHQGYRAVVEFDAEDEIFAGRILGINDVVGFHGSSVEEVKAAFVEAVEDYLETCAKLGKKPDKDFSGNLMLRVDPSVHALVSLAAGASGKSVNQWSEDVLRNAVAEELDGRSAQAE